MIKKPVSLFLTAALTMGLAACANPNNQNIANRTGDRIGMNTYNRDGLPLNGRYDRNNVIDRNGSLALNRGRGIDDNLFTGKYRNRRPADTLSAAQTTLNSDQYPHTSAVLIQDAKYQYVPIGPNTGNSFQGGGLFQPLGQFLGNQGFMGQQGQYTVPQQTQVPGQTQTMPQQTQPVPGRTQTTPQQLAPSQSQTAAQPGRTPSNTAITGTVSQYVQQVIDLTNAQRRQNGLPSLKTDAQLSSVAQRKAIDMQQNHYFSHTSPTYGSPFDMMRDFGVTYSSAGENIAMGQPTPQEVVTAWMNSPGHRANILNRNYTNIGVGFESTGKHWSQMFIGK